MAAKHVWEYLPSIIIVEILSYLSLTDRINTSSVCKRWRTCLFHPSLWKTVHFKFKYGGRKRARFLSETVGRFVHQASIEFNAQYFGDVRECLNVLQNVGETNNLEKLVLKPSSFQVSWPEKEKDRGGIWQENTLDLYVDALENIIKNARHLRHLSLGCIEELTDHADNILTWLSTHQSESIQSLHLASVKADPDWYGVLVLPVQTLAMFSQLNTLSLDYDYLTNALLRALIYQKKTPLQKLLLHVHGVEMDHEKITNATWQQMTKANPNLEVTLNLVHSIDGSMNILDILQPAMPLVHFRMFFCGELNIAGINFIGQHMSSRVQSMYIIDGMNGMSPNLYDIPQDEDPFVMLAWKCPNLKHFSLIGYDICSEDLIAIARLRGTQLLTLEIPLCCISLMLDDDSVTYMEESMVPEFSEEISQSLGQTWSPISTCQLHPAVKNTHADADTAYLAHLLKDQAF